MENAIYSVFEVALAEGGDQPGETARATVTNRNQRAGCALNALRETSLPLN